MLDLSRNRLQGTLASVIYSLARLSKYRALGILRLRCTVVNKTHPFRLFAETLNVGNNQLASTLSQDIGRLSDLGTSEGLVVAVLS